MCLRNWNQIYSSLYLVLQIIVSLVWWERDGFNLQISQLILAEEVLHLAMMGSPSSCSFLQFPKDSLQSVQSVFRDLSRLNTEWDKSYTRVFFFIDKHLHHSFDRMDKSLHRSFVRMDKSFHQSFVRMD